MNDVHTLVYCLIIWFWFGFWSWFWYPLRFVRPDLAYEAQSDDTIIFVQNRQAGCCCDYDEIGLFLCVENSDNLVSRRRLLRDPE